MSVVSGGNICKTLSSSVPTPSGPEIAAPLTSTGNYVESPALSALCSAFMVIFSLLVILGWGVFEDRLLLCFWRLWG